MATWKGKSKGTPVGYRIFIWIIKTFGLGFSYLAVRFVTFYYFLFARETKKQLRLFYAKVPGVNEKNISKLLLRNFNRLAESLIDRIAFLSGVGGKITHSQQGEDYLKSFADSNRPLIIISAHLGNWEIAGNFLQAFDKGVNVVMFDGESERLKKLFKDKVGEAKFNIIAMREDNSHIYAIHKATKNGETICFHGDRFTEGAKTLEVSMFGKAVELPYGPFQIAARLNVHYCFIFSVKSKKYHYHFTSTEPTLNSSPQEIAERFAKELEQRVVTHPEQWYNYHPFFKEDASK